MAVPHRRGRQKRVRLTVERQLRTPETEPDLWLLFAPIKRARLDWLVEKASELGVSALVPVWTARTQPERLNEGRMRALAIAASEQSERLSVPEIRLPASVRPGARRLARRAASGGVRRDGRRPADRRSSGGISSGGTSSAVCRPGRRLYRQGA